MSAKVKLWEWIQRSAKTKEEAQVAASLVKQVIEEERRLTLRQLGEAKLKELRYNADG